LVIFNNPYAVLPFLVTERATEDSQLEIEIFDFKSPFHPPTRLLGALWVWISKP
jgi:hypothetical protein